MRARERPRRESRGARAARGAPARCGWPDRRSAAHRSPRPHQRRASGAPGNSSFTAARPSAAPRNSRAGRDDAQRAGIVHREQRLAGHGHVAQLDRHGSDDAGIGRARPREHATGCVATPGLRQQALRACACVALNCASACSIAAWLMYCFWRDAGCARIPCAPRRAGPARPRPAPRLAPPAARRRADRCGRAPARLHLVTGLDVQHDDAPGTCAATTLWRTAST